jgi:lysophospholipase L1-like esterase
VRVLRLGAFETPKLLDAQRRPIADLSRILQVFDDTAQGPPSGLTKVKPGTLVYGWYDRPRWSYFDAHDCVEYRTNSLGFRDHEFSLERKPGELRILALGDSFTFGSGVQLDDTWPEVLERELRSRRSSPVEVVNAGLVWGFKPDLYSEWFERSGARLDGDLVIVGLCLNDVFHEVPLAIVEPAGEPWLGGHVRLLALAQQLLAASRAPAEFSWELNVRRLVRVGHPDWIACQEGLRSIHRLVRRDEGGRARLLVAIFPMLTRLATHYPFGGIHQIVRDFCAKEGIECVDLLDRFVGADERELWVHPTDQHPNDVGNRIMARAILDYLAQHPPAPR